MTEQEKHPLRCETCGNVIPAIVRTGYKKCKITNFLLDKETFNVLNFTAKIGCCNHSDAVNQDNDRQETLSKLISENARIIGELHKAKELISRLNGEHDEQVQQEERGRVLGVSISKIQRKLELPLTKGQRQGLEESLSILESLREAKKEAPQ